MFGIIYLATNLINNKIYVGQTKRSLEIRITDHYNHIFDNTYFHKALKKYDKKDWKWEIIDSADTLEELNDKEIFWIDKLNSMNPKVGYNRTRGGDGYPEMDKINYDKSRETRISKHYTSEELEAKEKKYITRKMRHKAVRCIETNQIFIDPIQAAFALFSQKDNFNLDNTANAIRKCARGDTKTARGYHWEYLAEEDARIFSPNCVCLIDTGEIFRSIQQAAALKHQSTINIRRCCNGEIEDNAGYHWKWLNK